VPLRLGQEVQALSRTLCLTANRLISISERRRAARGVFYCVFFRAFKSGGFCSHIRDRGSASAGQGVAGEEATFAERSVYTNPQPSRTPIYAMARHTGWSHVTKDQSIASR
jgi:hypothetical protein